MRGSISCRKRIDSHEKHKKAQKQGTGFKTVAEVVRLQTYLARIGILTNSATKISFEIVFLFVFVFFVAI
jgi:site-specific recombinase